MSFSLLAHILSAIIIYFFLRNYKKGGDPKTFSFLIVQILCQEIEDLKKIIKELAEALKETIKSKNEEIEQLECDIRGLECDVSDLEDQVGYYNKHIEDITEIIIEISEIFGIYGNDKFDEDHIEQTLDMIYRQLKTKN